MSTHPHSKEPSKAGPPSDQGDPQPKAAEVESARLLANDAKPALTAEGVEEDEIRRLADEFIAKHLGEGTPEFIAWAKQQARTRS